MTEPPTECPTCEGCGRVATDDEHTPWKYWEQLRPPSDLGVRLGLVRPIVCPDCSGSGRRLPNATASAP